MNIILSSFQVNTSAIRTCAQRE